MITVLIFYASLFGIIGMIYLKARRLKLDTRSRFSHLVGDIDIRIRMAYRSVRVFVSYFNRRSAVALMTWIAYHVLARIRRVYIWVHDKAIAYPHSRKVIDMVRGKGEVSKMGGASFYLKRITPEEVSTK